MKITSCLSFTRRRVRFCLTRAFRCGRHLLREFLRFISIGLAAVIGLRPAFAAEAYIFGDSGADIGNYFLLPGITKAPNAPYSRGPNGSYRLSDGPMWPELLYSGMRYSAAPGRTGNLVNYAYGGATSGATLFSGDAADGSEFGLTRQLDAFDAELASGKIKVSSATSAFLYAGTNDLFAAIALQQDPTATIATVAQNLKTAVSRLTARGITKIYVSEIADFGYAPAFQSIDLPVAQKNEFVTQLNRFATQGREVVRTALAEAQRTAGGKTQVIVLPLNTLFAAIRQNPAAFGFTHITGQIYDEETGRLLVSDPARQAGYLFVDGLHTTARAQQIEAGYYRAFINVGEGVEQRHLARVTDAGVAALDVASRAAALAAPEGALFSAPHAAWNVSLLTPVAHDTWRATATQPSSRTDTGAALLAFRWSQAGPAWQLAAGFVEQRGRVEGDALRFEQRGALVSLRNAIDFSWASLTAEVSHGWLDLDTRRDGWAHTLAPGYASRGNSSQEIERAALALDRSTAFGQFFTARLGFGLAYARAKVDGFHETSAVGLDLKWRRFDYESFRAQATAVFSGQPVRPLPWLQFTPELALAAEHEFADTATEVAAELPLGSAGPITGRLDRGDRWRFHVEPRLRFTLARHATAALAYAEEHAAHDATRRTLSLTITQRF